MNEVFFIHDEVRRTASRTACPHPNMEELLNMQPQYNAMENLVKKFSIEPRASDPLPMTKNVVVTERPEYCPVQTRGVRAVASALV